MTHYKEIFSAIKKLNLYHLPIKTLKDSSGPLSIDIFLLYASPSNPNPSPSQPLNSPHFLLHLHWIPKPATLLSFTFQEKKWTDYNE